LDIAAKRRTKADIHFAQADGRHLRGQNKPVNLPASEQWRKYTHEFSNLSKAASKAGLFCGAAPYDARGKTQGKLWLDDLSVRHAGSDIELVADGDMEAHSNMVRAQFNWAEWDAAMERSMTRSYWNTFILSVPGLGGGDYHSRREGLLLGPAMGTAEH
jgi:hypothetical protein